MHNNTIIVPPEFIPVFLIPMIVLFYMMRDLKHSLSVVFSVYILLQIVICFTAYMLYS